MIFALVVLSIVGFGAWFLLADSLSAKEELPKMHKTKLGSFVHDITNNGSVESSSNVEITCRVKSDKSSGSTILKIIPEGTVVKEGDELVVLDSYPLEKEKLSQQIVCNKSEADVIQATNVYETAVIAKKEYIEGTYKQEVETIESEIFVAMENLSRAEEYLKHSQRLFAKRYVTEAQLEADRFAVEKAKKDLAAARTKMNVLQKYTKVKMVNQLEADIKTSEAKLKAAQTSHDLDVEQLQRLKEQITNCTLTAPQAGQVVYASESKSRHREAKVIEEGAIVREGQAIIRLPDATKMQVKTDINEAKVTLVKEGMAATVILDAFPDRPLEGIVGKVNEYPEPTGWFGSSSRVYETTVKILETHKDVRPGMTAQVKIHVQRIPEVMHVPVQSVFEHGGKFYCVIHEDGKLKHHEVKIGETNDKVVIIREGLKVGQEIVHHVNAVRERLNLPKLKETDGRPGNGRPPRAGGAKSSPGAAGKPPAKAAHPPQGGGSSASRAGQMFQRFDKNGDGKLQMDEMPEQMRPMLKMADKNGDGAVDRDELTALRDKMGQGGPPGGGRPGAKP